MGKLIGGNVPTPVAELRKALDAAAEAASAVCETTSLLLPIPVGKTVAIQVPITEWAALVLAVLKVEGAAPEFSPVASRCKCGIPQGDAPTEPSPGGSGWVCSACGWWNWHRIIR